MVAPESSLLSLQRAIYKFYGTTSLIKGIVLVVGRLKPFFVCLGSYPGLASIHESGASRLALITDRL